MLKRNMQAIIEILDNATILSIVMISVLLSILTLTIPIAAQTLVNFIAFGKVVQPVITLSLIVLVLMIAFGVLNIWQSIIIEVMQQKIMVKISLNLTEQFTHLSLNNFYLYHGQELVNRFFEVVTIKKSVTSILIYGINMSLQLLFGFILLLIYHPIFLVFDLLIIFGIFMIIYIPYKVGLESAEAECNQKHRIGSWLEEILNNKFLFKFNNFCEFATKQTDKNLIFFLKERNRHFKQLIKHQIGFYFLSAISSSVLLGIGGLLVIRNQLSLGQLVAAEIVLGVMIYSFRRFSGLLEDYYDLMASNKKIQGIMKLPTEIIKHDIDDLFLPIKTITLSFKNYRSAVCKLGIPLIINVKKYFFQDELSDYIFGFKENSEIKLKINNVTCNDLQRRSIRPASLLIRGHDWFVGSILDNLRLHFMSYPVSSINKLINEFDLTDKIASLDDGLYSIVYDWENIFSDHEIIKLMLIRAIIADPNLIVVDRVLDNMSSQERGFILHRLKQLKNTVLIFLTCVDDLLPIKNCLVIK